MATDNNSTHFYLSSSDVDRLMRDHSPDARLAVLNKVAEHYRVADFSAHELAVAEQIFRLMMRDVEVEVRKELSEHLKDMPGVPRDIVLHLAQDVEEVAVPVIQMSQVLSDADLVYLVQTSREVAKLQAVTKRETVSERVVDAVVEAKYPEVVESLMANPGATVSPRTLESVVSEFGREGKVMDALASRDALPLGIVEKLVNMTSHRMAMKLAERYDIDEHKMQQVTRKAREAATLTLMEGNASEDTIDQLVGDMLSQGKLTPSLLFTALARGQVTFFVCSLARFAHIPRGNALRLAVDRGEHGFKALYSKSELPQSMYEATRILLAQVLTLRDEKEAPGTRTYANKLAQMILADPGAQEIENMAYMLALVRQNVR